MDHWDSSSFGPVVRALRVVYGAMVAHATEQGESPLQAVNVERLISAVRLLAGRRDHEAAPFVATWKNAIEEVDGHALSVDDHELEKNVSFDLETGISTPGLSANIAKLARDAMSPGNGAIFGRLEEELLRRTCLLLASPRTVGYLAPLVQLAATQPGGLDVITLNYDTTIEDAVSGSAVTLDTGLRRWKPGTPLTFPPRDSHLNLLKLHGSVTWAVSDDLTSGPLGGRSYLDGVDPRENRSPLMVIGDREKLETDGPTLALMHACEEVLTRASRLVVVGYSFRDRHVDTVIRNWLLADASRTITILDPGWPAPTMMRNYRGRQMRLREALRFDAGVPLSTAPGRVVVVKQGAADGLDKALVETPLPTMPAEVVLMICLDERPFIRVTNFGYDLERVQVAAPVDHWSPERQAITRLRLDDADDGETMLIIPRLGRNESVQVHVDLDRAGEMGRLRLSGSHWGRTVTADLWVQLRPQVS